MPQAWSSGSPTWVQSDLLYLVMTLGVFFSLTKLAVRERRLFCFRVFVTDTLSDLE